MKPSPEPLPDLTPGESLESIAAYTVESVTGENAVDDAWAPWFRLLVENANDLIYIHGVDGKMLYVNRRLVDVTGWRREEILGRNILELLAPGYQRNAMARREQATSVGAHRYEVEIYCQNGVLLPLEVHSTPVTEGGRIVAWQGIARDIRERRRAQARMAAVYETARQVVGILNLDEVLAVIATRAAEITGALACSLWLVEDAQGFLRLASPRSMPDHLREVTIPVNSDHPAARALREREAVISPITPNAASPDRALPEGTRAVACLPLDGPEGTFGVISLSYAYQYVPEPEEVALLSTFASHAAAAISNARLFEAQRRKTQEVAAIGQIGMTAGTLDAESVLHVAGAYTYDLYAADMTAVLVLDKEQTNLSCAFFARRGVEKAEDQALGVLALEDHPLLQEAVRGERTQFIGDVASHPLAGKDASVMGQGMKACLLVPLVSHDRALGVLLVAYLERTVLTDMQIRLAETLAQQAAVALENATMFQAIATAKREWEAAFDAITDPVCSFSMQGKLLRANIAASKMVGVDVSDLTGRHYHDVFYGGSAPDHSDIFQECSLLRRPVTREVENLAMPGVFQVTAYPLLDDAGKAIGIVEYVKDITEQREIQARLYHSARLAGVGELAAGVVHNFRNVLMGVSGMLDVAGMLLEQGGTPAEIGARLQDAQEHVFRGNQVLQRLLDFARGTNQEVTEVQLDVLLPDVVALCKAHPASRGIRLRTELPIGLPPVRADAGQLHEVLLNLVLNALQAITGRGMVTVTAFANEEQVSIEVADTGCGIPEADLERIFEPFYSRRSQGASGTGIGLSASLRMVKAMGGQISVRSQVGEGTTFTVSLPAAGPGAPVPKQD